MNKNYVLVIFKNVSTNKSTINEPIRSFIQHMSLFLAKEDKTRLLNSCAKFVKTIVQNYKNVVGCAI